MTTNTDFTEEARTRLRGIAEKLATRLDTLPPGPAERQLRR